MLSSITSGVFVGADDADRPALPPWYFVCLNLILMLYYYLQYLTILVIPTRLRFLDSFLEGFFYQYTYLIVNRVGFRGGENVPDCKKYLWIKICIIYIVFIKFWEGRSSTPGLPHKTGTVSTHHQLLIRIFVIAK